MSQLLLLPLAAVITVMVVALAPVLDQAPTMALAPVPVPAPALDQVKAASTRTAPIQLRSRVLERGASMETAQTLVKVPTRVPEKARNPSLVVTPVVALDLDLPILHHLLSLPVRLSERTSRQLVPSWLLSLLVLAFFKCCVAQESMM